MSHFNFYFTRASKLPEMIDHMAKYYGDRDIGIHFKKSIDRELNPYAEHIWKLSNLTALSFDFLPQIIRYRTPQSHFDNFLRLSKLVEFPDFPIRDQGAFLNLRKVDLARFSDEDLIYMTNIEELTNGASDYEMFQGRNEDAISLLANPDRVTSVWLNKRTVTLSALTRLTNLQSLSFADTTEDKSNYVLSKLTTSIRQLAIGGRNYYDYYNLTNLTSLSLEVSTEHIFHVTTLHKLKKLEVRHAIWMNADYEVLDLAPLTALESLIWRNAVFKGVFATIRSPHLTYLEMETFEGLDLGQISYLQSSLKELVLESFDGTDYVDYSQVSQLTGLVSLIIRGDHQTLTNIEALTNLTRLEARYLRREFNSNLLPKLTNLERLALHSVSAEFLNDILPFASKLTYLEAKLTSEHFDKNPTCLATMTNLRVLMLDAALDDFYFWQDLPKLTNLHALAVWKVDSEEKLISLSTLTNLTTLNILRSKSLPGDELTRLTSLQTLTFVSKVAKATIGKPKAYKKFSAKMPRLYQCSFK